MSEQQMAWVVIGGIVLLVPTFRKVAFVLIRAAVMLVGAVILAIFAGVCL